MRYNKFILSLILIVLAAACSEESSSSADTTGQGGSMTRFAFSGEYLYILDRQNIQVYTTDNLGGFSKINDVSVGFGLETIFAKGEYLYLGALDAMYIYSIAQPSNPAFVFRYSHIVSCDPVVVQGNRAYVTLRSGNACNRGANALEIIDISDPYSPVLVANYPMESPHGLGVFGSYLFLCEGEAGLKVFDISNERSIQLVKHVKTFFAWDVIVKSDLITVTGEDGIFQFEYPVAGDVIREVSRINVERNTR